METPHPKARILTIDDDLVTLGVLRKQLSDFDVVTATCGEEGLEKAHGSAFDLILLDIVMPGIDGFEVLERLRTDARTVSTPVILLTVLSRKENIERGFSCGADDYLIKPIEPWELQARVSAHIERHRMRKALLDRQKHQALQQIAVGLSHEINNPLFIIRGFSELLGGQVDPTVREYVDRILNATERVASIVRALNDYAQERSGHTDPVDLNRVIRGAAELTAGTLAQGSVRTEYRLCDKPLWVRGSPSELTHVFVGLLLAARKALPRGGVVSLESADAGDSVTATLHDKASSRAFGPAIAAGAGPAGEPAWSPVDVGLLAVRRILDRYSGSLSVFRGGGRGTVVQVTLPTM